VTGPDGVERPYKRLSPLTPVVRSFLLVVAVVATSWDDFLHGDVGPLAWLLLAMLVAGAVYGAASWLRTKYWIEADELRVDTGLVSRQSRRIRVDRLQGIDIAQPFVARLFGLAELRMDVAGGGQREGSLAFLRLEEAEALREALLARRDAVRAERGPGADGGPDPGPREPTPRRPEREVARLDLRTLVISLMLSPETFAFLLAAVVFATAFGFFGRFAGVASVTPVLIGFGLTQFRRLSAFYGFVVTESDSGLHVRRGLFERNAQTISLARVQGVVVTEPLLWRGFGWARLDVAVAGYASSSSDGDGRPSASTVMPVAPRALVLDLARTLLAEAGGPDPDAVALTRPPERAGWVSPVRRRFMSGGVGEHLVVSREGMVTRRTHVVPHARVQSLRLHQGVWQHRLGLADLHVDSPPGPVTVRLRHRDAAEARALLERENAVSRRARRPQGSWSRLTG
jgi:putative membrane protein